MVWFDIAFGGRLLGRLEFELYENVAPLTAANFRCLCTGREGLSFKGSGFHRLIPGFMIQGGDFTNGDGTGGRSIYGKQFDDEPCVSASKHSRRGLLSMANSGLNTNGSQFFILFAPAPHLDGKHVVFGHLTGGWDLLDVLEKIKTGEGDKPKLSITIADCGGDIPLLGTLEGSLDARASKFAKESKIMDKVKEVASFPVPTIDNPLAVFHDVALERASLEKLDQQGNQSTPLQDEAMSSRKRKLVELQRKKAEARLENLKQVMEEHKRNGAKLPNKYDEAAKETLKEKNELLERYGVDPSQIYLLDTAESVLKKKLRNDKKEENIRASIGYHAQNEETAHRSYLKHVAKIPMGEMVSNVSSSVLDYGKDGGVELEAKERLAQEIVNRNLKVRNRNAKKALLDGEDVTAINSRNEAYNKMVSKTFDKYTAEIRENLERGTAL